MKKFNFSDEAGIWVRVSEYAHPSPIMPSITLLPMIHIGEKEFFKEMSMEMWRHETVFLEGCYMPGRKLFHLFHRSIGKSSKLSLQSGKLPIWKKWSRENRTQGKMGLTEAIRKSGCECGNCDYDELRTIRADLHRWHALKAFKQIPLWAKLTFPFLIFAALIAAPFMNFRDYAFEDQEENQEEAGFFEKLTQPFWKFALDDRDLFLRMVLAEEIMRPRHEGKRLCVKYGAKHMPALAETVLKDFGYALSSQREVLAVKKTKAMDVSEIETGYGYANTKYWEEKDLERAQVKDLMTELTESDFKNLVTVTVKPQEYVTDVSYSIQTDLSGFNASLIPVTAASHLPAGPHADT